MCSRQICTSAGDAAQVPPAPYCRRLVPEQMPLWSYCRRRRVPLRFGQAVSTTGATLTTCAVQPRSVPELMPLWPYLLFQTGSRVDDDVTGSCVNDDVSRTKRQEMTTKRRTTTTTIARTTTTTKTTTTTRMTATTATTKTTTLPSVKDDSTAGQDT